MSVQVAAGSGERVMGILDSSVLARELEVEFARSRRYENAFALLRITVTDPDGLTPSDALLHLLSGAVRLVVRWSDSVAREADSQYLVLLRETDAKGARITADKLLAAIHTELAEDASRLCFRFYTAAWRKGDHLGALFERLEHGVRS